MANYYKLASLVFFLLLFYCLDSFPQLCSGDILLPTEVEDTRLRTYIIHVQRPKYHEFLQNEDVEGWHKSFLPNTTLDGGKPRLVYSYRHAISGFAARLTLKEVRAMESREGFLMAKPSRKLSLATTYTPKYLGLSRRSGLWVDSKMGQGVIIGVVDTGITPTHPSFQDDGTMPRPPSKWKGTCYFRNKTLCNNKLIGGRGFDGSPKYGLEVAHGTHVAGIAAGSFVKNASSLELAKGTASGISPKAHLAIYTSCARRTCYGARYLGGIDQAIEDGVDILSLSLGDFPFPFYEDNFAIGTLSAVTKNIFVCMVAGNSGPRTESVENGAPWILTVGASSHDRRARAIVRLANGVELEGESGYQPRSFNFTGLPIVYPGFADQDGTPGCQTFGDVDIKGKIVVCISEDLSLTPREMGINVRNAGGVAMIALSGKRQGSTTFSDDHVLPAIHLNHSLARKIERYFRSSRSPHKAAISFRGTRYGAHPSPTIPYFSGRGPHRLNLNGGILKPDIVGPGVNILSAWPIKPGYNPRGRKGSYFSFQSGTSMATPHLAGVVALLKSSHKKWSPAAIKSAIMTTADRFDHDGNPILDDYHDRKYQADLFAMGSGQVNPTKANDPGLIYDIKPKEYIKYLCGLWSNDTLVTIAARKPVQCSSVGSIAAEQLNYPSISVSLRLATYKSITRTLTNVGDADEIYFIQVEEPEGISVLVSPVILRFTKINQKKKITIRIRSISTSSKVGDTLEGQLMLDSGKHLVRSPISVTIV